MIKSISKLGFPWKTQDPFLFCVYHLDFYPEGNSNFGPATSLSGRNLGNDFVIKDGFRMYHGSEVPGFPVHPHRGFETVTFVVQGLVDHSDSLGASGRYGWGDVQWMTTGKGLQHAEMFPLLHQHKKNTLELFQIWLNLPASDKFVEPDYKMLWNEDIPHITINDSNNTQLELDLVAGDFENYLAQKPAKNSWAASSKNEVRIWQIKMNENAEFIFPPASGTVNRSLYFFEGESALLENETINSGYSFELADSGEIKLKNGTQKSRFLFLQGKPINEPIEQYGPFVMNNMVEIRQAFEDYRKTQFGGWPWPKTDMVHGNEIKRFATYINGEKEERPVNL